MYDDLSGEVFLNRLYKDLNQSDIVKHTAKGTKNKDEALKRYMDRLEVTHSGLTRKADIERLKALYYKKYIIKKEDIPNMPDEEKEKIIRAQKESLDKWLDYLISDDAKYPMWAKYWVFQGMLKIGTYDEASDTYQKRSSKTIAPFIEFDQELIARSIEIIMQYIKDKNITEESLHTLIESGNFQKLYILLIDKKKKNILLDSQQEDGKWITYYYETAEDAEQKIARGEKPEYLKLYESLQGHHTGWCTAQEKETAKGQICGYGCIKGGNFLVYYTKDEKGEYKIPRIAIRMSQNRIVEIRGVAGCQNLEDGLETVIEKKLKEIPNLIPKDIVEALKKVEHAKKLTLLNRKAKNEEPFTIEDLKFIWEVEEEIKDFGEGAPDARINKIRKNLKNIISKDIVKYKPLILTTVQQNGLALQHVPKETIDKDIALTAVQQNGFALQHVPKEIIDKDIALTAVQQNGFALQHVPKEIIDKDIALTAVRQNYYTLKFIPKEMIDKNMALTAFQQNIKALEFIPKEMIDKNMALTAVRQDYHTLYFIPKEMIDKNILLAAVQQNSDALNFAIDYNLVNIKVYQKVKIIVQRQKELAKLKEQLEVLRHNKIKMMKNGIEKVVNKIKIIRKSLTGKIVKEEKYEERHTR